VAGDDTKSPTMARATDPGTLLGTVGYMAPSRCGGTRPTRARTSSRSGASFTKCWRGAGVQGESAVETMNAILKEEPPEPDSAGAKIPPDLDRLVRHCWRRARRSAFSRPATWRFDLESQSGSTSTGVAPSFGAARPAKSRSA